MPPQIQFKAPPVFTGKKDEDAADCLDRYETIARYNQWTDAERYDKFGMFMEGTARLWFHCLQAPNEWNDVKLQ